jgi:hypothetical protein
MVDTASQSATIPDSLPVARELLEACGSCAAV